MAGFVHVSPIEIKLLQSQLSYSESDPLQLRHLDALLNFSDGTFEKAVKDGSDQFIREKIVRLIRVVNVLETLVAYGDRMRFLLKQSDALGGRNIVEMLDEENNFREVMLYLGTVAADFTH